VPVICCTDFVDLKRVMTSTKVHENFPLKVRLKLHDRILEESELPLFVRRLVMNRVKDLWQ